MEKQLRKKSKQSRPLLGLNNKPYAWKKIPFKTQGFLTLGVEIELQIISPSTYSLVSCADKILRAAKHLKKIKPEFYLSTIEVNTEKCQNVQQVELDLNESLNELAAIAKQLEICFATTGSHPFTPYSDCIVSPATRYQNLVNKSQWVVRRMTVYGLHVHLGMRNGDECIRFNNFFMNFIPHLLALSASSPFWHGIDTGLSSCRVTTYEAMPTAGSPYQCGEWQDFEKLVTSLEVSKSISSFKDLWWDIRPSPDLGTLEIRICDGAATLFETLAITAFIHTLAYWFIHEADTHTCIFPSVWLARENKWRAIRYGLEAELILNDEGHTQKINANIRGWVKCLMPCAIKLGYIRYLEDLLMIIDRGSSAARQRKIFKKSRSLREVAEHNAHEFIERIPCWQDC